ncbi:MULTISPECIES: nitroreductase family deazaflavin-dependent oxidoreductase [unclassified Microbacterium]|uniref:nitroreductase family deazaflavin-dependent oxidoreductase n=1 Tax=unclassified Microbacterium TaxID=2609290 RepID=UPI00214C56CA|nr:MULTISPECIES: nitroreductase family deazaflavin-dependent oxidoreductase [unclassified Microbacterium]MCR2784629.1 nitroreductase family deazaflavin-dependent oxidoreductase [Microbacterium sp. zg.B96]WIM16172.1 nitroreductase family deazaflavin-dependent oxidoreductase [Microbacterium sp. zg-B96]
MANRLVTALRRLLAPVTRTRTFRRIAPTALPVAERFLARVSGGRLIVSGILVPSLVLHTIGAKSGQPRETQLMYTPDGRGGAIVAGTSFARDAHPAWTANLAAHPDAEVVVRGRRHRVHAERIPAAERDAAWALIEAQWPGYRQYERDSGRTVRLFRLTTDAAPSPFTGRL